MNYHRIYQNLVIKTLNRNKIDMIVERHHILPKSMGGSDRKNNIVYLTPREHYIAHLLLWKIYRNKSMSHAFWMMCHTRNNIRINSKQYELLRKEHSQFISESNKGKVLSEETKQKIRDANIGREDDGRYIKIAESNRGRTHSEETKKKMSIAHTGVLHTVESRKKISESQKGKIITDETKQKISESLVGNIPWNKGISPTEETRKKMSEVQKGKLGTFTGKMHSVETKKLQSKSAKNRPPMTEETKAKLSKSKKGKLPNNSKSVIIDNISYLTIKEAAEKTGLSYYKIQKLLLNI